MSSSPAVLAWGYWGWGEATEELVARFDAVERSRGFATPLLVDVRASRSVRASGFKANAFEKVIGPDRYRWLQGLGNAAVATGKGSMRLVRPEAARDLLALVQEAAQQGRRVIFFCSCESPGAAARCHRSLVATTLLDTARAAGVALSVQEWPGGEPTAQPVATFEVPRRTLASLRNRKTRWVSLGGRRPTPEEMGMPVGSLVQLTESGESLTVTTDPPCLVNGVWKLALLMWPGESDTCAELLADAQRIRQRRGLEAKHV